MKKAIIGKKIGMTQIFDEKGKVVPVTVVEAGPCAVTQVKTTENDGYNAIQVGFGDQKAQRVSKPLMGHFKKGDVAPKKVLKEFRLDEITYNVGDLIKADVFANGDKVDVTGTSKGKGYAGVIKRWNFQRLKETHGTGPVARHGGSNGAISDPSRVWKGKKMALISTCGYPVEKGADLWEEGMKRYAKHSRLQYVGMASGASVHSGSGLSRIYGFRAKQPQGKNVPEEGRIRPISLP